MKLSKTPSRAKNDSLNVAATGIYEPSENPNKQLPHGQKIDRATQIVDSLEHEMTSKGRSSEAGGAVELDSKVGPNDMIVGPDLGGRPHRPATKPRRRA